MNKIELGRLYWFTEEGDYIGLERKDITNIPMVRVNVVEKGSKEEKELIELNRKSIFRPIEEPPKGFRAWIENKITHNNRISPESMRYFRIHVFLKNKIVKNCIRVMKKLFGRYLLKGYDAIPAEAHNNNLRILYKCYEKAFFDTICGVPYDAHKKRPEAIRNNLTNRKDYEEWAKETNFWSYNNRMSILNMYYTEVLEDTFDREFLNYLILNLYHELNDFYDGDVPKPGDYPVFSCTHANNPKYFATFKDEVVWEYGKGLKSTHPVPVGRRK